MAKGVEIQTAMQGKGLWETAFLDSLYVGIWMDLHSTETQKS